MLAGQYQLCIFSNLLIQKRSSKDVIPNEARLFYILAFVYHNFLRDKIAIPNFDEAETPLKPDLWPA